MSDWDGVGLPPGAQARLERFGSGSARTSLLSVPSGIAAESVGLSPVGEVMGSIVEHIGFQGWGGCGYYGAGAGLFGGFGAQTVSSSRRGYAGYAPYVDALYRGYDTALRRMLTEAQALGADGVVGVRITVDRLENHREFVALGTAVRAQGTSRPAYLFATDLPGEDVTKLLHAGWMPVGIAYGISVAIRHDDWATRQQQSSWAGNTEVSGYTELVTHVRADARHQLDRRLAAFGAEGCVGVRMSLHVWEIEPAENHRDHVAEATVFGSAIVGFADHAGRTAVRPALTLRRL